MSETSSTAESTECETLLAEAETVIVDLLDENAELLIELEASWTSCETIVRDTATEAVAAAARPLLVEIAGLKAERDALRRRLVPWVVGGVLTGLVAGFLVGALAF